MLVSGVVAGVIHLLGGVLLEDGAGDVIWQLAWSVFACQRACYLAEIGKNNE